MACFRHKLFTDLACVHCVNSERASYNCVLASSKESGMFTSSELAKVTHVKEVLKAGFCECKKFTSRPTSDQKVCHQCNLTFSLAFFNSNQVMGSGSFIDDETKAIPHPPLDRSTRSSGVKFKSGNYPNSPKFVKDTLALLGSTPDQGLMCSFCNKPVDFILASYGMGSPRQILTREIIGADELGNPIYQQVIKHTSDRLVACPDHVSKIKPITRIECDHCGQTEIKCKCGSFKPVTKITHSNCFTVSEG